MIINESSFDLMLVILKGTIIVLWIIDVYLKYAPSEYQFMDIQTEKFWAAKVSFVFDILIGFLLIYLFNPFHAHQLTKVTKITLFTFGIMTIVRADWTTFMSNSTITKH